MRILVAQTQRSMLVRQKLGAMLLLFPAEAEDLLLAHGRMFDVEVLQHNCNGIFSILSAFFYQKPFDSTEPLGVQLEITDIPLEMCPQI